MTELTAFRRLDRVEDKIAIAENPELPACVANKIIQSLDNEPTTVHDYGNDDSATCTN